MMSESDEDDDDLFRARTSSGATGANGGLLQVGRSASMDDYIKESEDGLSQALGPRWNSKTLEQDADLKTKALLRGISGPRALGAIHGMMGAMRAMHSDH